MWNKIGILACRLAGMLEMSMRGRFIEQPSKILLLAASISLIRQVVNRARLGLPPSVPHLVNEGTQERNTSKPLGRN